MEAYSSTLRQCVGRSDSPTSDGSAILDTNHAAGIYEVRGNKDIAIPVAAGMTVHGRFTKIEVGTSKVIAYK